MLTMKQIVITYDDSKPEHNLSVSNSGFTDAEVLVILAESQNYVKDTIIAALKKKASPILSPHMMQPISKA
jgi:hypothetical protein